MKDIDKNKQPSYIQYFDANNLYGWAMSQPLPVSGFKWIEKDDLSKFDEKFIKKYDENSDKGYIFEAKLYALKKYMVNIKIYHFYLIEKWLINVTN